MSDLEQIVRPSQSYSIRPLANYSGNAPVITSGSKVVKWGSSGANIFQLQASINQKAPPTQWPKEDEEKRTYDVVRVSSSDDPDTYVEMEAMTSYQSRNQIDKSRTTLNFAHTEESDTVKVISRGNVRFSSTGS